MTEIFEETRKELYRTERTCQSQNLQVISRALSVWGLDLVPRDSSDPAAVRAKASPIAANAYICNYRWLLKDSHSPDSLFTWFSSQGALVCHQKAWKPVVQPQLSPGRPRVGERSKL